MQRKKHRKFQISENFFAFAPFSTTSSMTFSQLMSIVVLFSFCRIINDAFMHLMKHRIIYGISYFRVFFSFQDTELLVLGCLKWDVSCVTPLDFIDLIISRLPIVNKNCTDIDPEKIRKHAQAFISLAVRGKFRFLFYFFFRFSLFPNFKFWSINYFRLFFSTAMEFYCLFTKTIFFHVEIFRRGTKHQRPGFGLSKHNA